MIDKQATNLFKALLAQKLKEARAAECRQMRRTQQEAAQLDKELRRQHPGLRKYRPNT